LSGRFGRGVDAMRTTTSRRSLGRRFGWLWAAYAVSTFGTWVAFDAFPLIAILALRAGPMEVSALAAAGLAVAAVVAVPLGPWVEFRRKRPVMMAMDLTRFVALMTVPVAYSLGCLTFVHLVLVAVIVGAAGIAFRSAGGAFVKELVAKEDLLVANARLEATTWTATFLGPPIGGGEAPARKAATSTLRVGELLEGWRYIPGHAVLRPLFVNTLLVNGLILATSPLIAVLMLGELGFAPWQYALAFGAPCVGGVLGARLSRRLVARFGQRDIMRRAGALRACWSIGLAFIGHGAGGIALVMAVQFGLVTCVGVFNPVFATYRLDHTPADRVARVLTAWSVSSNAVIAALTAAWGLLAALTTVRIAIAIAGVLMLATPLLLPRRGCLERPEPQPALGLAAGRYGSSPARGRP
jgi:MFS family permease